VIADPLGILLDVVLEILSWFGWKGSGDRPRRLPRKPKQD
jgi:hypothetical protein